MKGKGNIVVLMVNCRTKPPAPARRTSRTCFATKECSASRSSTSAKEVAAHRRNDITTNWVANGMKFDAIISNNDEMAIGAIQALKAARKWRPDCHGSPASTRRRMPWPR